MKEKKKEITCQDVILNVQIRKKKLAYDVTISEAADKEGAKVTTPTVYWANTFLQPERLDKYYFMYGYMNSETVITAFSLAPTQQRWI